MIFRLLYLIFNKLFHVLDKIHSYVTFGSNTLFYTSPAVNSFILFQPFLWYGDNTDIHRVAILRKHSRLDMYFRAVRTECRVYMIGSRSFVPCREEHHLGRCPVDAIESPVEVVSHAKARVGRPMNMPEAAPVRDLSCNMHLSSPDINDAEAGRLFTGAGRAPRCLLAGIGAFYPRPFRPVRGIRVGDRPVPHNGKCYFIGADDRFVSYPFVFRFRVEGAQTGTVCIHYPCTLRGFPASLPAKQDLPRFPGVTLNMAQLKGNRNHVHYLTRVYIHP